MAGYVLEQHKPAIFVMNKWDLMVPMPTGKIGNYVRHTFPNLDFVPIAFITAKSGKNVQAVLNLAQNLHKQVSRRASTGDLNRVLRQALDDSPPPLRQNRRPKVYYGTQVGTNPPTIVLFTNGPELFDNTYQRYLVKTFRDRLGFSDVPIKLYLRKKQEGDEQPADEEPADPSKKRKRLPKPEKDVSGLKFQTTLDDDEAGGDSPYESELWKDL
jgi:GTP-binding protein